MEKVQMRRYLELIEEGLEGQWEYEGIPPQFLFFTKPPVIGSWGILRISKGKDLLSDQIVEYEVVYVANDDILGDHLIFINLHLSTPDQTIQYRVQLDFLNSYTGGMHLIDTNGKTLYYHRVEPREDFVPR